MNCPTCRRQIRREDNPFRPFCSERCRLLDLNGWLSEQYRIPAEALTFDETEGRNLEDDHE
ncbi:DNA gyrase inhibitor YacG [Nitrospira sp. M1]